VSNAATNRSAARRAGGVGFSALTALLIAATPKCPLCWVALMGALGVGTVVDSAWLRPLAFALLLVSVGALFVRARRLRVYGPFVLGLAAAAVIYVCKFEFSYDAGVYLGGAGLLAASIWNGLSKPTVANHARCRC
jgi:hypothetical protein